MDKDNMAQVIKLMDKLLMDKGNMLSLDNKFHPTNSLKTLITNLQIRKANLVNNNPCTHTRVLGLSSQYNSNPQLDLHPISLGMGQINKGNLVNNLCTLGLSSQYNYNPQLDLRPINLGMGNTDIKTVHLLTLASPNILDSLNLELHNIQLYLNLDLDNVVVIIFLLITLQHIVVVLPQDLDQRYHLK
jgi:hypothetical protein